ncbi:MCE family protein [Tsukamurella paurometabola]|uniref:Virulence factor Mce family protein n=1 Tax=Tsukamurella paurometabola (strain ATCC 8368 / DSM 20162 / CCUG 35730 / CIP 100753 / JCM 10117 / KCTC 9821 / NBRC 16120 / NCIMB 702349 / NCTC 13040) TaxID=521096 RepID=D5UQ85_TSUPD|nr:MCE family protein [Tsukamurella paurometabola]ADG78855.1 virulence factor Mce family protein [Tsukamurella paurometabola DSM 20162]SUP33337.1 virulence factor Mce family protein [Tsukamurella paurometabola]
MTDDDTAQRFPERRRGARRSPVTVGAMGIVVLLMATASAFFIDRLPLIGAGTTYTALFSEAAGLLPSNEVRVAGVKVGTVQAVELDTKAAKAKVTFRAKDVWLGENTSASIQIKTVLGQKYVALEPRGANRLDPQRPITDTTSPYDVVAAFSDASASIDKTDTTKLAASMRTLADAFRETPPNVRESLTGITRLSETINKRDEELQRLLDQAGKTSKILADRTETFRTLITDAGLLLTTLNQRQDDITRLLRTTQSLSTTLTGIVRDNEQQIGPALASLRQVVQLLQDNKKGLESTITLLAPFYKVYANVFGNGRWQESVVTNLTPPGLPVIPGSREPVRKDLLTNGGQK